MKITFYFLIIGGISLLVWATAAGSFARMAKQGESENYIAVPATVAYASVVVEDRGYRWHSANKKSLRPHIAYSYRYQGKMYKGHVYRFYQPEVSFHHSQLKKLDEIPEYRSMLQEVEGRAGHKPFSVFINPHQPEESVVDNGPVPTIDMIREGFGSAVMLFLLCMVFVMRKEID